MPSAAWHRFLSPRNGAPRRIRGRRPRPEVLEDRTLLSGAVLASLASQAERMGIRLIFTPAPGPYAGLTPSQIRHAYGVDHIFFGNIAGDGSGQTIAIVAAYDNPKFVSSTDPGFLNSDLHRFDQAFGLPDPPSFRKVAQDGSARYPPADSGWAGEIALDVEWAHAIAPGANILLVEANDPSNENLLDAAVGYARGQPGVSAVSMSFYSNGEARGEGRRDHLFTTPAGHAGITFLAASGDSGRPGGYPAYSANVVAVGGTSLVLQGGNYLHETGWSGSGGGPSFYFGLPAYQRGVVAGGTHRSIPDVAFDADPASGVAVFDSYNGGSTPWAKVGGTSLACPAWAGLIAIADQGLALRNLPSLDGPTQTLPRLYALAGRDFHDVTGGDNGYRGGPGYDLVTGLGSPIANRLVLDLAGFLLHPPPHRQPPPLPPPPAPTITPVVIAPPSLLPPGADSLSALASNVSAAIVLESSTVRFCVGVPGAGGIGSSVADTSSNPVSGTTTSLMGRSSAVLPSFSPSSGAAEQGPGDALVLDESRGSDTASPPAAPLPPPPSTEAPTDAGEAP